MAANYNFSFDTGADLVSTLTWLDENGNSINLTGCTAVMSISPRLQAATTVTLTLGGIAGTLAFDIPGSVTATWTDDVPYSIFVTSAGGIVTKLMYGNLVKSS